MVGQSDMRICNLRITANGVSRAIGTVGLNGDELGKGFPRNLNLLDYVVISVDN